jgi:hypothetical protein
VRLHRFFFLLLLAACASAPSMNAADWSHAGKEHSDFKLDLTDCERFFGGTDEDKARCMTAKGWRPVKRK